MSALPPPRPRGIPLPFLPAFANIFLEHFGSSAVTSILWRESRWWFGKYWKHCIGPSNHHCDENWREIYFFVERRSFVTGQTPSSCLSIFESSFHDQDIKRYVVNCCSIPRLNQPAKVNSFNNQPPEILFREASTSRDFKRRHKFKLKSARFATPPRTVEISFIREQLFCLQGRCWEIFLAFLQITQSSHSISPLKI